MGTLGWTLWPNAFVIGGALPVKVSFRGCVVVFGDRQVDLLASAKGWSAFLLQRYCFKVQRYNLRQAFYSAWHFVPSHFNVREAEQFSQEREKFDGAVLLPMTCVAWARFVLYHFSRHVAFAAVSGAP